MLLWVSSAGAAPILNTDEFFEGGLFGPYTNSGELIGVHEGNNTGSPANRQEVEEWVEDQLGFGSDFELTITDNIISTNYEFDSNGDPVIASGASNTGTWAVIPPAEAISFYAVKAGNFFAMYLVDPADSTGSWSTYDIWKYGQDNNLTGAGGLEGLEISHFNGYNPGTTAPVPEPATIFLLGTGLVGIAGIGRKRFKK